MRPVEPEPDPQPNEPAGYVRFAEHTFEALPSVDRRSACEGTLAAGRPANLHSLASAENALFSPPGVFQFWFPPDLPTGFAPGHFFGWAVTRRGHE
jgi:hypothetical protein